MPTTTSLNLQALLKTAAARTGMDSSASHVRGLSPSAQALYVAVQSSHRKSAVSVVVVPGDEDVDRFCIDITILHGRARRRVGRRARGAPSSRSRRCRSIRIETSRRISVSPRRAPQHCTRIASGTAKVVVASAAALLTRLSAPDNLEAAADRAEERDGSRSRRAGRSAGRRRLYARGPGRRARRVLRSRRHRRLFSGRRRQSDSRRVRWRDHRVDPPVRSIYSALDRNTRSGRRCSADREIRLGDLLRLPARRSRPVLHPYRRRGRGGAGHKLVEQTHASFEERKPKTRTRRRR